MVETCSEPSVAPDLDPPTHCKTGQTKIKNSDLTLTSLDSSGNGIGGILTEIAATIPAKPPLTPPNNPGPSTIAARDVKDAMYAQQKDLPVRVMHPGLGLVDNTALQASTSAPGLIASDSTDTEFVPSCEETDPLTEDSLTDLDLQQMADEASHLILDLLDTPSAPVDASANPPEGVPSPAYGSELTSNGFAAAFDHPFARVSIPDLDSDLSLGAMPPIWDKPPQSALPFFKKDLKILLNKAHKINAWKYRLKSLYLLKDKDAYPKSIESIQPLKFDCPDGVTRAKINEQMFSINEEYKRRVLNLLMNGSIEYFEKEKEALEGDYRALFQKIQKYCEDQGVYPQDVDNYLRECRDFFVESNEANKKNNEVKFQKREHNAVQRPKKKRKAAPQAPTGNKKPKLIASGSRQPADQPEKAPDLSSLNPDALKNLGEMLLNFASLKKSSSSSLPTEAGETSKKRGTEKGRRPVSKPNFKKGKK